MKKILFFLFLSVGTMQAQSEDDMITFDFSADYKPAEITFMDGHKENGFIYGFIDNTFFTFDPSSLISGFKSIESSVNLNDKHFDFKNSLEGSARKLTVADIKNVLVTKQSGNVEYGYYHIKTANAKGEIVDTKKSAWLPFIKKDKIDILGYNYFQKSPGTLSELLFTPVYLHRNNEDFVIVPIDFNGINLFSFGKIDEKFMGAITEVFKDCPVLIEKMKSDAVAKKPLFDYDTLKEDLKELKKTSKDLPKKERKKLKDDLQSAYNIQPYINLINQYKISCP